ncbi:MAG: thiazole synthase [Sporolactobacillus sp.]|jgi:thiazole synthase|nr:thiazole synthase [Sporolactobacillus sp.]
MLTIGRHTFQSHFLLGTGKFNSLAIQKQAVEASGANILTFAIRRMNVFQPDQPNFLEQLDLQKYTLLPNTAGSKTAKEAVRTARLAKASGLCDMIKVEIVGDEKTLLPEPLETFKACEILLNEGFTVLPYVSDDLGLARRMETLGVHAIMPGAAPIGSGQGLLNPAQLRALTSTLHIPVIVDAGIGSPADATLAMMLGAQGILLNSAVSRAQDPVKMARAMRLAIEAGRLGYEAGRIPKKTIAVPSSPTEGMSAIDR